MQLGVPVPPASRRIMPPPQRAIGHGATSMCSNTQTKTARSGCAGVPSRVLRTRDRCAPLPSLTLAYGTYCTLQIQGRCVWRIALGPLRVYLASAIGGRDCTRLWCGVCTLPLAYGTYCTLQIQGRCVWRIALGPLRVYLVPFGSTGMYSQNYTSCNFEDTAGSASSVVCKKSTDGLFA